MLKHALCDAEIPQIPLREFSNRYAKPPSVPETPQNLHESYAKPPLVPETPQNLHESSPKDRRCRKNGAAERTSV